MNRRISRRSTPWEGDVSLTPTQAFLKRHYDSYYADRHRKLENSDEAEMINSYIPTQCPFCKTNQFKKSGFTKSGIQRYMCGKCGKTFLPTTGTIFDERRISISEWMEYCLNLFRHVSITADSWNNKNDFKTSRYWLQKLFLIIDGVQDNIVLSGKVWLDETFYTVRSDDIVRKSDGNKLRGLSDNQICIGVATDKRHTVLLVEGTGKPSQKKTYEAFKKHIKSGSVLVHDGEAAHTKLVRDTKSKQIIGHK